MGLRPAKREGFSMLRPGDFAKTLTGRMTPVVDRIRDLLTPVGQRPYSVRLVWTRWSEGERGEGTEEVIREFMLLPTPKVGDLEEIESVTTSVGSEEFGEIEISEISGRFTEDFLLGRDENGQDIPKDQQFYWEVEFISSGPPGAVNIRRRLEPSGTPNYDPQMLGWKLKMVRAGENRRRDRFGTPED